MTKADEALHGWPVRNFRREGDWDAWHWRKDRLRYPPSSSEPEESSADTVIDPTCRECWYLTPPKSRASTEKPSPNSQPRGGCVANNTIPSEQYVPLIWLL